MANETWDTRELIQWVDNDEGLYETAQAIVERDGHDAGAFRFCFAGVGGVDADRVDWDAVATHFAP